MQIVVTLGLLVNERLIRDVSPLLKQKGYAKLEAAGQLAQIDHGTPVQVSGGNLSLHGSLPRQAVSLLRLDWSVAP